MQPELQHSAWQPLSVMLKHGQGTGSRSTWLSRMLVGVGFARAGVPLAIWLWLGPHPTYPQTAMQVISKRKLTTPEEIDDVKREVQIMHHLAGHQNVVNLKGVYEDRSNVCLVMEVCTGGELFDSIVKRGHYTEKDAAALIRTIVGVVAHCHNMGVIHRDLKPENFLLSDKSATAQLKATDFGLSSFFQASTLASQGLH